jgi:hypothetical protein
MHRDYQRIYLYMFTWSGMPYRFNKVLGVLEYYSGTKCEWATSLHSEEVIKLIGGPNAIV